MPPSAASGRTSQPAGSTRAQRAGGGRRAITGRSPSLDNLPSTTRCPISCRSCDMKCKRPGSEEPGLSVLAGGLGFEPRLTESESVVLPLDDPPSGLRYRFRVRRAVFCAALVVLGNLIRRLRDVKRASRIFCPGLKPRRGRRRPHGGAFKADGKAVERQGRPVHDGSARYFFQVNDAEPGSGFRGREEQ